MQAKLLKALPISAVRLIRNKFSKTAYFLNTDISIHFSEWHYIDGHIPNHLKRENFHETKPAWQFKHFG
jgi:hypothetical protein